MKLSELISLYCIRKHSGYGYVDYVIVQKPTKTGGENPCLIYFCTGRLEEDFFDSNYVSKTVWISTEDNKIYMIDGRFCFKNISFHKSELEKKIFELIKNDEQIELDYDECLKLDSVFSDTDYIEEFITDTIKEREEENLKTN